MGLDQARPGAFPAVQLLDPVIEGTAADALLRQLQERLNADQAVRLDGAQVNRISTAALQILAAAQASARARSLDFSIQAPSQPLETACHTLGLSRLLKNQGQANV